MERREYSSIFMFYPSFLQMIHLKRQKKIVQVWSYHQPAELVISVLSPIENIVQVASLWTSSRRLSQMQLTWSMYFESISHRCPSNIRSNNCYMRTNVICTHLLFPDMQWTRTRALSLSHCSEVENNIISRYRMPILTEHKIILCSIREGGTGRQNSTNHKGIYRTWV
jgi:hypothetical protein